MRAVTQLIGITAASVVLAATAGAQAPRHEFGVDMGIASAKFDGSEDRLLTITAPADIRIGFVTASPWMLETRFGFDYNSSGGTSALSLAPGLNLLWKLTPGTGMANQMGPYVTAGASIEYIRFSSDELDASQSANQLGVNVGIGTRLAWGSAAFRPELFFHKGFESGDETDDAYIPALTAFGLRVGVSLWR